MPLLETKGAGSAQGFGEFTASAPKVYIEDVFSTYLYVGNNTGSNEYQGITNGIDLATKGGLVWLKKRSGTNGSSDHALQSSTGGNPLLQSNNTNAGQSGAIYSFDNSGFALWLGSSQSWNYNAIPYVSWTFRKQPKFFDVVTYTGNGSNRTISHNLGSVPGCIIVKRTDTTADWQVYHRSTGNTDYLVLNGANQTTTSSTRWNNTSPTSTVFSLGTATEVNANGGDYVAYLFAHDAGGFGLSGADNVISCGSLSGPGTTVNLGYEPQWILAKRTDTTGNWYIDDNMRGWPAAPQNDNPLLANSSSAEPTGYAGFANITSTGFTNNFNGDYIYIAIRRGPMKVPTSGTSVFSPVAFSGTGASATVNAGFPSDSAWLKQRNAGSTWWQQYDRLRGNDLVLASNSTNAETNNGGGGAYFTNTQNGITLSGTDSANNGSGGTYGDYFFRRAPGFFDVVCYTGTGSATTFSHNLGVVPELMIVKKRNVGDEWAVYSSATGNTKYLVLNTTVASATSSSRWDNTSPTSSVFTVGLDSSVNSSGSTYVAYLFATLAGVSKVGSYTGSGTTKQIDCGFTGGARFVLIKRADSTGDWYVYDSARGIVSGDDPYLFLNSTAAEVTNTDYVDTYSAGFELSSTAPAGLNANGGTYIFLAIA